MFKTVVSLCALSLCASTLVFAQVEDAFPEDDDTWMHPRAHMAQIASYVNDVEDYEHWQADGQDTLNKKLGVKRIEQPAKHIIFFLGDGMSVPTITAARIYKGQREGSNFGGEEASLFMDSLPNVGVSKTFCSDAQTADSACSATAYLGGTKANIGTIGVKPTVKQDDCAGMMVEENRVKSIMHWAQEAGMSTGIVTTTRITHASPSGAYAHTANRDWENDGMILDAGYSPAVCSDIAKQLIRNPVGQRFNVVLGGGRREFHGRDWADPINLSAGRRRDGLNLEQEWIDTHPNRARHISNKTELLETNATNVDYLFGLFNYDHLDYALLKQDNPSLEEMTMKAIQVLHKNPLGSVLFVEGGRIDHAHHDTRAQLSLFETLEFDAAIETANNMTSEDDTLILVTADHAHVFSIAGYPNRGNPLFNVAGSGSDNLPYPTLSYANGPGYRRPDAYGNRYDISNDITTDPYYRQTTGAPIGSETHGGDDVLILSRGPYSHLLTGVVMQSYIPHALKFAACIGEGRTACDAK